MTSITTPPFAARAKRWNRSIETFTGWPIVTEIALSQCRVYNEEVGAENNGHGASGCEVTSEVFRPQKARISPNRRSFSPVTPLSAPENLLQWARTSHLQRSSAHYRSMLRLLTDLKG